MYIYSTNSKFKNKTRIKYLQNGHLEIHEIIWGSCKNLKRCWKASGIVGTMMACGSHAPLSVKQKWVDWVDLFFLFSSILAMSHTITCKTKKNTQTITFTFVFC
jgi:hypothetical protein